MALDPRGPSQDAFNFRADGHVFEVSVRSGNVIFFVPRNRIIATSDFFRSMERGTSRTSVNLSTVQPSDFITYVNWLYSKRIYVQEYRQEHEATLSDKTEHPEYITLARLYATGHTLDDSSFQDAVLHAMAAKIETYDCSHHWRLPGKEAVSLIYKVTGEHSRARKFLVESYGTHVTAASIGALSGRVPANLLQNVAATILKRLEEVKGERLYNTVSDPEHLQQNWHNQHHGGKGQYLEGPRKGAKRIPLQMIVCRSCVKLLTGIELVWNEQNRCFFVECDGEPQKVPGKEQLVCIGRSEARNWTQARTNDFLQVLIGGSQTDNSNGAILVHFENRDGLSRCFQLLQYALDDHFVVNSVHPGRMVAIVKSQVAQIQTDAKKQKWLSIDHLQDAGIEVTGSRKRKREHETE